MSLSEAFASVEIPGAGAGNCKTCRWYATLEPEDKAFFDNKVADPEVNMSTLRKACQLHGGLEVVPSSFRNHVKEHHPKLLEKARVSSFDPTFGGVQ